MFEGISNFMNLLQNANGIGDRFQSIRDELKSKRVVGSSGGGMVDVEANGLGEIVRVKIDPALLQRQDHEMLEDLLLAAINQAAGKAREAHVDIAKLAAKDLNFPGLSEALSKFTAR